MDQSNYLVERMHKGNVTNLVSYLDRERGTIWNFIAKHQTYLIRL